MSNNEQINRCILEQVQKGNIDEAMAIEILKVINTKAPAQNQDIAIVGMGCRFSKAKDKDEFWENIQKGIDCVDAFSEERKRVLKKIVHYMTNATGQYIENGYFLEQIDKFDAAFFKIPPVEAELMEPHQRIMLETAWEAIEEAGYGGDKIFGTKTGVFLGRDHSSSMPMYKQVINVSDPLAVTGSYASILASRISYVLNLQGPSIVIDTACSSGLVAIHEACRSLINKECELALAGGIQLELAGGVQLDYAQQKSGISNMVESVESKIYAFDKNAGGTVWAEGAGVVLLKPLKKALQDRNSIYAVIKGSAVNNDGASNGITAPSAKAQENAILKAWENAKIDPATISYIEAHGTGTKLGDPVEVKGISEAFRKVTDRKQFCGIGSVKPSIGHPIAAAGVASLIKVALAMKSKVMPPSINFSVPNSIINFYDSAVYVNDRPRKWDTGEGPIRAGVSAFGFSGTNCHIVLEEAPLIETGVNNQENELHILAISAKSKEALGQLIKKYKAFVNKGIRFELGDICFSANTGRGHYNYRMALILEDANDLKGKLNGLNEELLMDMGRDGIYFGVRDISKKQSENEKVTAITALDEICKYYVRGGDVDWDTLYKGKNLKRVILPTYAFERKVCWPNVQTEKIEETNENVKQKEIQHPLLDRCLVRTMDECIFETSFSPEKHWVINEHLVAGGYAIPGTTYLEMAVAAGKEYFGNEVVAIKNVQFRTPLFFKAHEIKNIQTVLREQNGKVIFKIVYCNGKDKVEGKDSWTLHAEGELTSGYEEKAKHFDLDQLLSRFGEEKTVEFKTGGLVSFGQRWNCIRSVRMGERESLACIELLPEYHKDIEEYNLHPALMDIATAIGSVANTEPYLPESYGEINIFKALPGKFYSYIHSSRKENDTIRYHVEIIDESGNLIIDIQNFSMRKVNSKKTHLGKVSLEDAMYYRIGWIPEQRYDIDGQWEKCDSILILDNENGIGERIGQKLRQEGKKITIVAPRMEFKQIDEDKFEIDLSLEGYEKLLEETKSRNFSMILHVQSIGQEDEADGLLGLNNQLKRGFYSLTYLTKAIFKNRIRNEIKIVIITENASEITGTEEAIYPVNAALVGLGKVIPQEYANLPCRCMDVDREISMEDICAELKAEQCTYLAAYRKGKRFVEVLEMDKGSDEIIPTQFKTDGVYIITGGAGGIGLEICNLMASKNKVNLAIINRSTLPQRTDWEGLIAEGSDKKLADKLKKLMKLEEKGATISYFSADVSHLDTMKNVIQELREKHERINGIIHSAGIAGEGLIIRKEESESCKVLSPKVQGTWILHQLTEKDDLDFFVMFSSGISLTGGIGQGDYAAANAYMDSFSFYRNRQGKKTLTINWPAWNETGMALDYGLNDTHGLFKGLSNEEAMQVFSNLLGRQVSRVVIGKLNDAYPHFEQMDNTIMKMSEQIKGAILNKSKKTTVETHTAIDKVELKEGYTQNSVVEDIEMSLISVLKELLAVEHVDLNDNFFDLGGNSLYVTRLEVELEKKNISTENLNLFKNMNEYQTLKELAAFIKSRMV